MKKKIMRRVKKKKKKMSKLARVKAKWVPAVSTQERSAYMSGMMSDGCTLYGDTGIMTGDESLGMIVGVPLPSFCMEYLTQNTVWPLGRLALVVGIEGTCKTGFALEIMRWFIDKANGIGGYFEHESKYSPDWAMSIIGWENRHLLGFIKCDSINDWQQRLQWFTKYNKKKMAGTKTDPGPGRVFSVLNIIDSIMGKSMESTQAKIETEGFAGQAYPREAKSITDYLRKFPQDIDRFPMSLIAINHLKPSKDQQGFVERNKPGGKMLNFQETYEFEMIKAGKVSTSVVTGLKLKIRLQKNSLGVTHRVIPIEVIWWDEEIDIGGGPKFLQQTRWDWHKASMSLLLSMAGTEKTRRQTVLGLTACKVGKVPSVYSKELGISKKSPLSLTEAGKLLNETPEVLESLRNAFGIKIRQVFDGSVDYEKLYVAAKRRAKKVKEAQDDE